MATSKKKIEKNQKGAPVTIRLPYEKKGPTLSKYHRPIVGLNKAASLELDERCVDQVQVDVYDVLQALKVTYPARQHAIKKLLAAGDRGHKEIAQDLEEARQSVVRAQEILQDYQGFGVMI